MDIPQSIENGAERLTRIEAAIRAAIPQDALVEEVCAVLGKLITEISILTLNLNLHE